MIPVKYLAKNLALVFWGLWAAVAIGLLLRGRAEIAFVAPYIAYLGLGAAVLAIEKRDLLSPPGLFTLAMFLAFGLSMPLTYLGGREIAGGATWTIKLSDEAMQRAMVLVLLANIAFIAGYYSRLSRFIPISRLTGVPADTRRVNLGAYLVCVAVVVAAGFIRLSLHLGEAGQQPSIVFAGALQYALFDGVLLLCMWFLAQALRQSPAYVALGLSLLMMMAITQALLGWRGGIIQMTYVSIGLFWYQVLYRRKRRPFGLAWLLALVIVAGSIIQLGNEVRASRLGGEKRFASSVTELVEKIAFRSQGASRLAAITQHFGPLTFTNEFFIRDLMSDGISTTVYVDRTLYGISALQSHSVGTSGPGGAYVALGVLGVVMTYFALGVFYGAIYNGVAFRPELRNNILDVVLYSYLMFTLAGLLSENLGVAFLKNLVAVLAVVAGINLLIRKAPVFSR